MCQYENKRNLMNQPTSGRLNKLNKHYKLLSHFHYIKLKYLK